MKKYLLFLILSLLVVQGVFAMHIKGGYFTYQYLGPGINNPSYLRYKITLTIYSSPYPSIGPGPNTQIWDPLNYTVFQGNNATPYAQVSVNIAQAYVLNKLYASPCIIGSDLTGPYYHVIIYILNDYELPPNPDGYTISYQKCCRLDFMDNVVSSGSVGNTWSIHIPGSNAPIPNADHNSSPFFPINDTVLVCQNNPFTFPFGTTDPDGDSLSYSFCYAYQGGDQININPDPSSPPPYVPVPYQAPFSGSQPLGVSVTIDPVTGLVSGIAPPIINTGEYVVTVCVKEYRNGIYFADSRKELHIRVRDCTPLQANPNFTPITCDGFTVNFQDQSTGNPDTYSWNFGDPASGANNTSILPNPTHTFTAAGIFNIKLVVSIAGQCVDSIVKPLGVFPGFFPGFTTSAPLCVGQPVQFTDTTKTNYGVVDSWRWDFGDLSVLSDTSHLQDPTYIYNPAGTYNVQLIVTNSKGCEKTITVPVTINATPAISVFPHDSTYCGLDTLQLTGTGTGSFNWTPNYNIIGANTATPLVYPAVPTRYYVQLTSAAGCKNMDSLNVIPKFDLTNAIAGPTTICEEDTVTLTGTSNYFNNITWQWGPPGTIESPTNAITRVYPITNTTYTLTTHWGNHCVTSKTHTINVIPLAIPNAGPDVFICVGSSVQLNASGGNTYSWTPTTGLSNPNIPNPIASPVVPTTYTVTVGVTGCSKTRSDDVFVDVGLAPVLSVFPHDSTYCGLDTLQLTGTGTGSFVWTPNYNIIGANTATPRVYPAVPTKYYAQLTNAVGCKSTDSSNVIPKFDLTNTITGPTTICEEDTVTLTGTSNYSSNITWQWGPLGTIESPTSAITRVYPITNTTYTLTTHWGSHCVAAKTHTINVIPLAIPNAGPDTFVCAGSSVQLNASGGNTYSWTPVTGLSNPNIANPIASPIVPTTYTVSVGVTGCSKTRSDDVFVDVGLAPALSVFPHDTTYCGLDTLQLTGTGTGSFAWTPNYNIIGANTATPRVYPAVPTKYYAQLTNAVGCKSIDSLNIIPKFDLTNDIAGPTNICEEDTVTLTGSANYVNSITWQWGPPGSIETPNSNITRVYPISNTTYTLITGWGSHCVATKTHTINVKPLAIPNAGPDTYVCPGNQNSVQLNASGGDTYTWTPTTGLSNPNIPNPIASPIVPTTYTVAVGVTGCSKTRSDDVFVNVGLPPALTVMNDTLICNIDTLQITTIGTGTYAWTPNYMISSLTSPNPFVSPDIPTLYHVRITDPIGCHTDDSIFVDVKTKVTIDAGPDTSMCATDTIVLKLTSDALLYNWSPATYLNSATLMHPTAIPLSAITYYVIGNIGKCQNIDSVHIRVGAYPSANAGPDTTLCPGFSTQLHASGGTSYLWSPVTFLNDRTLADPTCTLPFGNIRYVVTVSDTLGCPKGVRDTVWVMLHPKAVVDAGPADTIVVEGEPLLLNAIGNGSYLWSPNLWLNNNTIVNPISLPHGDITYKVLCTTANGCLATDIIRVKWFNVDPDIYVPTAWAPNGKNRELAPILRGMKQLNYFRIFNRFGEMVFETTQEGVGWDGVYKGKAQDVATFVWYAEGITYKGQVKRKKGYAVLIR